MRSANPIAELVGARASIDGVSFAFDNSHVDVLFASGRSQRVAIEADDTHILFESIAVRRINETMGAGEVDELLLRTNHATESVGLRRTKGALTAFVKILSQTLDRDDAIEAIVAVAREADRLEQLMTGRDEE